MKLQRLELVDFKNLNKVLDFDADQNIIIGANGKGKTNILEAIYFLSKLESFRTDELLDIFPWDKLAERFSVGGMLVEKDRIAVQQIMVIKQGDLLKKQYKINHKTVSRQSMLNKFPVFLFLPKDLDLVNGSPKLRRKEIDSFIEMLYPEYGKLKLAYAKVLLNRNKVIRQIVEQGQNSELLGFWDAKLIELGSMIVVNRIKMLNELKEYMQLTAKKFFRGEFKDLELNYISKLIDDDGDVESVKLNFVEKLSAGRYKELAAMRTLYGPQRDDFEIFQGKLNVQKAGSRGQQRLVTLFVKFAMYECYRYRTGNRACILLDDVMSELDDYNKLRLEKIIKKLHTQVIFTTTTSTDFSKGFLACSKQIVI